MVSPVNIHTSNTIETEQVIFENLHVIYAYKYVIKINEKRGHESERK